MLSLLLLLLRLCSFFIVLLRSVFHFILFLYFCLLFLLLFSLYLHHFFFFFFFFNDTATTEIYTLSLHDALSDLPAMDAVSRLAAPAHFRRATVGKNQEPARCIGCGRHQQSAIRRRKHQKRLYGPRSCPAARGRSEEHTSELQSPCNLVCRLLLEK